MTSVVDARQLVQVLLGFGDMGEAHMQHRMVADVPALTGAMDEGMDAHRSIMIVYCFRPVAPDPTARAEKVERQSRRSRRMRKN